LEVDEVGTLVFLEPVYDDTDSLLLRSCQSLAATFRITWTLVSLLLVLSKQSKLW